MSFTRPILFWIAMLAAVIAVVALLREVLLPFVAGMVLAYLLDPVANRIERLGMNRLVATLVIIVVVITAIALLIALTVPIIISELAYFIESFPQYLRRLQSLTTDPTRPWLSKLVGEGLSEAERSLGELTTLASSWLGTFLRSIWSGGRALISIFSLAVVTPIVAFYLAAYYALALWLIGLKHGVVIGFAAGLLSFIPYLGSLSGLVISTCVAIAQFWPDWTSILLVPAIFFVGQFVADYVLAPYLVGRRVHLSPVWVMFALFAFGYLFGFVGLLIAVPLAAAIGVLMRFALRQYYASPLYAAAAAPTAPSDE